MYRSPRRGAVSKIPGIKTLIVGPLCVIDKWLDTKSTFYGSSSISTGYACNPALLPDPGRNLRLLLPIALELRLNASGRWFSEHPGEDPRLSLPDLSHERRQDAS